MEQQLYDIIHPDSGQTYTVAMTSEEALRCTNDIDFAMEIIARQECVTAGPQEESTLHLPMETQIQPRTSDATQLSPAVENTTYRWRESNINLLLQIYKEMKSNFEDPKISQKKAWLMVAEEANKCNSQLNVTGLQCMTKMRSLKKIYKSIKDHNNKSGNDRRTWKHYETMHEIFGSRAWATPRALVSSDTLPSTSTGNDAILSETATTTEQNMPTITECPSTSTTTAKDYKTTLINLLKEKNELRKHHEAARQRRHEERLASDQALIQTIKDIFTANQ